MKSWCGESFSQFDSWHTQEKLLMTHLQQLVRRLNEIRRKSSKERIEFEELEEACLKYVFSIQSLLDSNSIPAKEQVIQENHIDTTKDLLNLCISRARFTNAIDLLGVVQIWLHVGRRHGRIILGLVLISKRELFPQSLQSSIPL